MKLAIRELHWDEVTLEAAFWTPRHGRLFAIWGAPFATPDACMHAAGFRDFDDSDDDQDDEFQELCARLLQAMNEYGQPTVQAGEYPVVASGMLARITSIFGGASRGQNPARTLANLVLAVARSDEFPPCIVNFGNPATASLRVQDGHAILWIHFTDPTSSPDHLLALLADGRPVRRTTLDWTPLVGPNTSVHGTPNDGDRNP